MLQNEEEKNEEEQNEEEQNEEEQKKEPSSTPGTFFSTFFSRAIKIRDIITHSKYKLREKYRMIYQVGNDTYFGIKLFSIYFHTINDKLYGKNQKVKVTDCYKQRFNNNLNVSTLKLKPSYPPVWDILRLSASFLTKLSSIMVIGYYVNYKKTKGIVSRDYSALAADLQNCVGFKVKVILQSAVNTILNTLTCSLP